MPLTPSQMTSLKAHIVASGDLNIFPNSSDGNFEVAKLMNVAASPGFTVWKKSVSINEVGKSFNATELAGLTSTNNTRLQTLAIYLAGGVDPSIPGVQAFFNDIFSGAGGTNTRAALLILWKRLASRAEKLFSTGTGSDASPATTAANIGEGFLITAQDVETARNLP